MMRSARSAQDYWEAPLPGRPPEAQLIYERRTAMGLSIREAARRASTLDVTMSEGSWRRTESDRRLTRTPSTLARMGLVTGVTPAGFRAAGRDDAARALQELIDAGHDPVKPLASAVRDAEGLTDRQKAVLLDMLRRDGEVSR